MHSVGGDELEGDQPGDSGDLAVLLWLESHLAANGGEWTGELLVRLLELVDDNQAIAKADLREALARVLQPALDLHAHVAKKAVCGEILALLADMRADMRRRAYEHVPRHEQDLPKKLSKIVLMQSDTNMRQAEIAIRDYAERFAPPKSHPDADLPRERGEFTNN